MIMLIFQYTCVSTSADSYGLDINYDGEYPNWIWDLESLKVEYRWGTSGTWTHLTYLDFWPYDGELSINDATNSVFQLRMRGCLETSDSTDHTWYFGEDPTLLAHYE